MEYLDNLDDLTCKDCLKQFKYKSLYQNHINKKNPCKPIINNDDNGDIDINDDIKIIKRKYINTTRKITNKLKKPIVDICHFCNKKFITKNNVIRHVTYNCQTYKELINEKEKYKKLVDDNKKIININKNKIKNNQLAILIEENKKLKEENKKLVVANNTINNITNNNQKITNNNSLHIHLNNFGSEDLSHLPIEYFRELLRIPNNSVPNLVKRVHFDKTKPENFNIYLEDSKGKTIKVYEDNEWVSKDADEIIAKMKDDKLNILDKKADEINDDKLKTKLNIYKNRLQNNREANKILDDRIKNVIHINSNMDDSLETSSASSIDYGSY